MGIGFHLSVDVHQVHAGLRGVQGGCDSHQHGDDDIPVVGREEESLSAG